MADDAGANARRAVMSAGAHRRDAVDELGFAHRLQRLRAIGPIHGAALDEYGGTHVVPTVGVIEKLVEQIAVVAIPQMMVWVDNRQIGFQHRLVVGSQPVFLDRVHPGTGAIGAASPGHCSSPPATCLVGALITGKPRYASS